MGGGRPRGRGGGHRRPLAGLEPPQRPARGRGRLLLLPVRRMEAPPRRGFSEEQFRAACSELGQTAPGPPWQLLVESMGVSIYRLYDEVGGQRGSPGPSPAGRGCGQAEFRRCRPGSVSPGSQKAACSVMLLTADGESRSTAAVNTALPNGGGQRRGARGR